MCVGINASLSATERMFEIAQPSQLLNLRSSSHHAKSCLVAGNGGRGKTLLMYRLLLSWAEGTDEYLQKFEFVFYVSGRDRDALKSKTALGLLALDRYGLTYAEEKQLEDYLDENSGAILIILDGGDEIGEDCEGLWTLLERRSLPDCTFLFTSRPCSQIYDVIPCCDVHYYLNGFSDRRLEELLDRRLGDDSGKRLVKELREPEKLPLWELMKETPLLANMVAQLANEHESLPPTMTEIYMTMVKNSLRRFAAKNGVEGANSLNRPISEWPAALKTPLDQLAKLALDGMRKSQFIFDMVEVRKVCGDSTLRSGILEEVETVSVVHGHCHQVQFSHLTWQEFFAALAVARDEAHFPVVLQECLKSIGTGEDSHLFWRFLCGSAEVRQLPAIMRAVTVARLTGGLSCANRSWTMFTMSCVAQAAQQHQGVAYTCANLRFLGHATKFALMQTHLNLDNHLMTLTEMTNLSITLQFAKHVKYLDLANCQLPPELLCVLASRPHHICDLDLLGNPMLHGRGIQLFANGCQLSGIQSQLSTLALKNCDLDQRDAEPLQKLLCQFPNMEELFLSSNRLGNSALLTIQPSLIHSNLRCLRLNTNPVFEREEGQADAVCRIVTGIPTLKEVYLDRCRASTASVHGLLSSVHLAKRISILSLCENNIDDQVVNLIAELLTRRHKSQMTFRERFARHRSRLTILLHQNPVTKPAVHRLASLSPSKCLDTVEVGSMIVSHGRVSRRNFTSLMNDSVQRGARELVFRRAGIDDDDVIAITDILSRRNFHLVAFHLGINNIGDQGICLLARALQTNVCLQALSLIANDFGEKGISALAYTLSKHNSTLRWMNLAGSSALNHRNGYTNTDDITTLIARCPGLHYLGLNYSGLAESDGQVIGDSLAMATSALRFLTVRGNKLLDGGVSKLCRGAQANSTLRFLDLSDNDVSDIGAASVLACVQSRTESGTPLKQVWLGDNQVKRSGVFTGCVVSNSFHPSSAFQWMIATYLDTWLA